MSESVYDEKVESVRHFLKLFSHTEDFKMRVLKDLIDTGNRPFTLDTHLMRKYDPELYRSLESISLRVTKEIDSLKFSERVLQDLNDHIDKYTLNEEAVKKAVAICEKLGTTEMKRLAERFNRESLGIEKIEKVGSLRRKME
jgi:hypothetical protein